LISAQNDTIAILTQEINCLRSCHNCGVPSVTLSGETDIQALRCHIQELAVSLPSAIEASCAKRLPAMIEKAILREGETRKCFAPPDTHETTLVENVGRLPSPSNSGLNPELIAAAVELQATKFICQQVEEVILPLVHDHVERCIAHATEHINAIGTGMNKCLRALHSEVAALKATLPSVGTTNAEVHLQTSGGIQRQVGRDDRTRFSGPSCNEFLRMAAAAKARLPPHQPNPVPLLCIRDANNIELIYIVHERRQKRCAQLGLGALSLQGALCLYLATRDDLTSDQKIELEDAARFEDDRNPRFPETRSCEQENSVTLTSIMPPTCGSTHSHSLIRHVPGSDK